MLEQLGLIIFIGIPLLLMPVNLLIIASIIGVLLADTTLVGKDLIYYTRFVPISVLAFRTISFSILKKATVKTGLSMIKSWLPFLILATISILYSYEQIISIQRVLSAWLVFIGFGLGIPFYFRRPELLTRLIWMICILMEAAVLYSLYSAPEKSMIAGAQEYERIYGIFRNPNTLGLLAMQLIFPLMYLWNREKRRILKYALFIIVIMTGVTVVASGSRASVLGFLVGLTVFIWTSGYRSKRKAIRPAFIAILLLCSIYITADYFYPEYFGGIFRSGMSGRTNIIEYELELSREAPYFGVGFGGSDQLYLRNILYLRSQGVYAPGSHNSFMRLLVDLGYVGVITVLVAFFMLLWNLRKFFRYFEDPLLGAILLSFVVASLTNSFFESWLFSFGSSSTIPFWLFLAILYYLIDQAKAGVKKAGRNPSINNSATFIARRITHGYRIK